MTFKYDAEHNRYLKTTSDGKETFYFGKYYERVTDTKTGEVQHKHFIYADGKLIALNTQVKDADDKLKDKQIRYLHYDALESVDMITDGYGVVVERRSYDTWGKQRKVSWREDGPLDVVQAAITNRGYTVHEEITEVGLIHMNGRVYDQELGRFISPDPEIQAPFVTNSFNRYSYVWNNPLKYQDPTGYSVEGLGGQCSPDSSGDGGSGDHGGNNGCSTNGTSSNSNGSRGTREDDDSSQDNKESTTPETGEDSYFGSGLHDLVSLSDDFDNWVKSKTAGWTEFKDAWNLAGQRYNQAPEDVLDAFSEKVTPDTSNKINGIMYASAGFIGLKTAGKKFTVTNSGTTTVGRWMSKAEHEAMLKSGKVQESYSGTTHVANPAQAEAFLKQAAPGSRYVEFNVPSSSLKQTSEGWAKIAGPNSL
ncbi:RHS repeat domain-containing protein [Vibrio rhizosphaerae]|uniref:RHS repeat domain-containing protein n=1 Tax=Vibrio rhizosphaerae TaxID=398736 RepID=UPI001FDEFE68|nr:RHS repeat-associated core domain-containing protein [Vibrio rhizosphaerae]